MTPTPGAIEREDSETEIATMAMTSAQVMTMKQTTTQNNAFTLFFFVLQKKLPKSWHQQYFSVGNSVTWTSSETSQASTRNMGQCLMTMIIGLLLPNPTSYDAIKNQFAEFVAYQEDCEDNAKYEAIRPYYFQEIKGQAMGTDPSSLS